MAALSRALTATGRAATTAVDPEFRGRLRQRLVAVATVQGQDEPAAHAATADRTRHARTQRRLIALTGAFAIVVAVAGVGVAASRSLPGQPFFGVKKATEAVQLWTTHGDAGKGHRHLEFAATRLGEANELSPTSSHLVGTLAAMESQTRQGATELIAAYQSSKSPAPLRELLSFVKAQYAGIAHLSTAVPNAVKVEEGRARTLLAAVVAQVHAVSQSICLSCGGSGS